MINQDRLVERFLDYIKIDSESFNEKEMMERVIKDLEELGGKIEIHKMGEKVGSNADTVVAKFKGNTDTTMMFSSHIDTVKPGKGIKAQVRDGVIYSDGTTILGSDDKAGVAAIIEMVKILKEENLNHHNLEIVLTIAEEEGLCGSKYLDYSKIDSSIGFVLDSGGKPGFTVLKGPAQNQMDITFKGKTAHAGVAPEEGISAIQVAAEAIAKMKLLRIDEETTANIGTIKGGEATNIVPDRVYVEAEARSLNDEKLKKQTEDMIACIREVDKKYGVESEIKINEAYKAFSVGLESEPAQRVKEACEKLGLDFNPGSTGGGSDTNNFNFNGIPSVNLGVGMSKVHTVEEFIEIEDMVNTLRLILEIAKA